LYVNVKEDNKFNINFELINLQGQIINKGNFVGTTILQTSKLEAGIYFIKFTSQQKGIDIIKFVKQ